MMLNEPPESEYDLRFDVMGFPVRISWTFWLGAVFFGFYLAQFVDTRFGPDSPGMAPLLILWTCCLLVSILIHELGHALAYRYFGVHSYIVLYHFGGLAVSRGSFMGGRSGASLTPKENFIVSAAGPALQILSAVVAICLFKLGGYQIVAFYFMPQFLEVPGVLEGQMIDNAGLFALCLFYVLPSVMWALLNLVPVWPLDGGQIARALFQMNGGTIEQSLWLSVISAGGLALYAFREENTMMAIFFLLFAINSYQMLQQSNHWRY